MKKIIRLTESQLKNIISKVISEQPYPGETAITYVKCVDIGVKSPYFCDKHTKKPVDSVPCSLIGVKYPGMCDPKTNKPVSKFKPQSVKEQLSDVAIQYGKQVDILIKKYTNTGLCDGSGMKKVFPYDEEVKKLQVLINKGEGKPIVKEDGMLGPLTKQYICSGGI